MIRGVWDRDVVGTVIAVSLLPAAAAGLIEFGADAGFRILVAAATVAAWQALFRLRLGVPLSPAGAVTAVAAGLLAPAETGLAPLVLAVSFGTVIGELVFGGWGRNVFGAAVVTLSFLYLSDPTGVPVVAGPLVAAGAAAALALLLATGIVALPVVVSAGLAFAAIGWAVGSLGAAAAASGTLVFALVYLVADPVASAATPEGRWAHGALAGTLAALILTGGTSPAQAAVFAALLASVFAPLIDQAVIATRRRFARGTDV